MLIVCGLHRSGTTFVGEVIRKAGFLVVHEPLNERFGMAGVNVAYPYCEEESGAFADLIDDAVRLARPWNTDDSFVKARGVRRQVYRLTGGRSGLVWGWLRLRLGVGVPHPRICLKDPFLSLATPWLVRRHGLPVVCMVRHPAAIHYSTEKQGWRFDIDNLQRQGLLIARYGKDIPEAHWMLAKKHAAASIALLWKLMVRVNAPLASKDERLLMVTHESFCLQPVEATRQICGHLCIPFTPTLEGFVLEHSVGGRTEAKNNRTHDFKRDSRSIPDIWRGKLAPGEEDMILDIAGEELLSVYGGK